MSYNCICCDFRTNLKTNYTRHLKTKKHLQSTKSQQKVNKKSTMSQHLVNIFLCKYCSKNFTTKQSMYRHIKYTCKKNKDEDLQELVKLMNEKIQSIETQIIEKDREIDKRDKLIQKLSTKLQINNNCIINTNNTFQLLNYKDTDISHLTDNDFITSIQKMNNCVKLITEKIHYNPKKPENMNIYISNLKNDYVTVYQNGRWELIKEFENIYEHKEILIEEWIEKEQNNYPELRDKFEIYVNNKENDKLLNNIKQDIKLMMYNNKNKVVENTKNIIKNE